MFFICFQASNSNCSKFGFGGFFYKEGRIQQKNIPDLQQKWRTHSSNSYPGISDLLHYFLTCIPLYDHYWGKKPTQNTQMIIKPNWGHQPDWHECEVLFSSCHTLLDGGKPGQQRNAWITEIIQKGGLLNMQDAICETQGQCWWNNVCQNWFYISLLSRSVKYCTKYIITSLFKQINKAVLLSNCL